MLYKLILVNNISSIYNVNMFSRKFIEEFFPIYTVICAIYSLTVTCIVGISPIVLIMAAIAHEAAGYITVVILMALLGIFGIKIWVDIFEFVKRTKPDEPIDRKMEKSVIWMIIFTLIMFILLVILYHWYFGGVQSSTVRYTYPANF